MSRTLTDAMGTSIHEGDFVCYIHKSGSSVFKNRRQITKIYFDGSIYLDGPRCSPVKSWNLVKTYDQNIHF